MKKILFFLVCFIFLASIVKAEDYAPNAISAILIEPTTGKIIYEKNSHEELAPASMTKIMTLLLTMEAIDEGRLSYNDEVTISPNASGMGGSQIFLEVNSNVKVEELVKGIAVASANDAAVALAEKIGGTVEKFVEMMNNKAQALGLKNTVFKNPHGLDTEGHISSAYDMAMMAKELLKHKDILKYTSIYEEYLTKPDGSKVWLVNTNKLVRFYEGVDGLKTGYTEEAGYCLTATATRNNLRLISVVMGEVSSDTRSKDTTNLLNYGFNSYKLNQIISKDKVLGKVKVEKGTKDYGTLILKEDVTELIGINDNPQDYTLNIKTKSLTAPVKHNDIVGSIEIMDNEGLIIKEADLTIKEDIPKANILDIFLKNLKTIILGNNIPN